MYITINDIIDKETIDLTYPIQGKGGPGTPTQQKSQLLTCLAIMFSIGYRDL